MFQGKLSEIFRAKTFDNSIFIRYKKDNNSSKEENGNIIYI